jgi:hypothetical protein
LWSAIDRSQTPNLALAGLATVDVNSMEVTRIGDPYYQGEPPPGLLYLGFTGGWDEVEGVVHVDLPDLSRILKLGLDGQVLSSAVVEGDAIHPYLVGRIRLPSGRWSAGHMARWLTFEPARRYWNDPPPDMPWTGMNGGSFSGGGATQVLDSQGTVIIAESWQHKILIRRFDDLENRVSLPVQNALWNYICPEGESPP